MTTAPSHPTLRPVTRALLSVSDKTGLIAFATALSKRGIALLSTGGTAKALRRQGFRSATFRRRPAFPKSWTDA